MKNRIKILVVGILAILALIAFAFYYNPVSEEAEFIAQQKTNPGGTLEYTIYVNQERACETFGKGPTENVNCRLVVKDLETEEVLFDHLSDDKGNFQIAGKTQPAPVSWLDDDELLIIDGSSGGCSADFSTNKWNVYTDELTPVYALSSNCTPGSLYTFENGEIFLFHFVEGEDSDAQYKTLEVYKPIVLAGSDSADFYTEDMQLKKETVEPLITLENVQYIQYEIGKGLVAQTSGDAFVYDYENNVFEASIDLEDLDLNF